MTARRFLQNYAGYLAARSLPPRYSPASWSLPRRFRYRLYWYRPQDVRAKPAHRDPREAPRVEEEQLLAAMARRFVVDGDWDLDTRAFDLHPTVEELFVKRLPVRSTTAFRWMVEGLHAGDPIAARGCATLQEVEQRFAEVERLYTSMARDGYRSQARLGRPPVDEISVCIGRWGHPLLLRHGNHRLSIAKVLCLPRVPVLVRGVHREWVRSRLARYGHENTVVAIEHGLLELSQLSLAARFPDQGAH